MKILLISTRMGTAGVETLILRMAKFLKEKKHDVNVLLMREVDPLVANSLRQYATVFIGWNYSKTKNHLNSLGEDYYDCIYTFSLIPLIYTMFIKQNHFPRTKICFGVYHPLEYCWIYKSRTLLARLAEKFMKNFPEENIFFMNEGIKERHEEKLKFPLLNAPIVPLPVDLKRFENTKRNVSLEKPFKIVSIGRITEFKTYNFTLLDVIRELLNNGTPVEYHIYGDGEQFDLLKNTIHTKKLENNVFLHGTISYDLFSSTLEDAFLFIGVGTALVEAAACKVPCLQAIEMDKKAECYGFFHVLKGYNLGEKNSTQPRYNILDIIQNLVKTDPENYNKLCELSWLRAQSFDIESIMPLFIKSWKSAKEVNYKLNNTIIIYAIFNATFWFVARKMGLKTPFNERYDD